MEIDMTEKKMRNIGITVLLVEYVLYIILGLLKIQLFNGIYDFLFYALISTFSLMSAMKIATGSKKQSQKTVILLGIGTIAFGALAIYSHVTWIVAGKIVATFIPLAAIICLVIFIGSVVSYLKKD